MGDAFEVIGGRVTNPSTTITALTVDTGDSFSVRSAPPDAPIFLYNMWAEGATAGVLRVRSPRMHDNVQGLRARYYANQPEPLLPDGTRQRLYPQDVLTVEQSGGASETDTAFLLLMYRNLPGIDARLLDLPTIKAHGVNALTVEVACTSSGTAGDWSAGAAINASFDLLKANTDYAILGYENDVRCGAVAIKGPETGNLRLGGPGRLLAIETRNYFVNVFQEEGFPSIPVFNAANKGATFVHVADPATTTAITVVLHLVELSRGVALT